MNGARLRVLRQRLGLDIDGLGDVLGVAARTVRRWESDKSAMSAGAVEDFTALVQRSEALVEAHLAALADARVPRLVTYANDEDFWAHEPEMRPLPAAWHRSLVGQVLAVMPDVEIVYPDAP